MQEYFIGAKPVITATFKDATGALSNPTTVVFMLRDPSGTETSVTSPNAAIVNGSTGIWTYTHTSTVTTPGEWSVRVKGTAGTFAAFEDGFIVNQSAFATP